MKKRFRIVFILMTLLIISVSFKRGANEIGFNSYLSDPVRLDTINSYLIKIDTFNLTIIPPSSGVQFYREGIIYNSSSKFEKKIPDNHISFGKDDARYALLNNNSIENIWPFSSNQPFAFPCEATTFSSDYNTMYFTRYSDKGKALKIYKAGYNQGNNGQWVFSQVPLNFCSDNSDYTHPALSADGKQLIFASNRNGSVGGMDLFVSYEKEGNWSEPVNLGKGVNTESDELFPYLDPENNLYFSSDGRKEGHGGFDLYFSKFTGTTWENPVNLSSPVNTKDDDIAFIVSRINGKSGFYTIRQRDGKRSVYLCSVEMTHSSPDSMLTFSEYFSKLTLSPVAATTNSVSMNEQVKTDPGQSPVPVEEILIPEAITSTSAEGKKESESLAADNSAIAAVTVTKPVNTAKAEVPAEKKKDEVVYRIQFQSNAKPKGSYKVTIDGKTYDTYEYQYAGAYRTTVGEFISLASAIEFQSVLRKSGYSQSFVVAFKNGARSNDPALFRR